MLVHGLIWYNFLYELCIQYKNNFLKYLRKIIGPEQTKYYVLRNSEIIECTREIPNNLLEEAFIFNPHTLQISKYKYESARPKRLNIIGLIVRNQELGEWDLSDWIGDIRIVSSNESMIDTKILINLWLLWSNKYLPKGCNTYEETKNDGTTNTYIF